MLQWGRRQALVAALASMVLIGVEGCAGQLHPALAAAPPSLQHGQPFTATAYCAGTTTAAGTRVRHGVVAADPDVLPIGSLLALRGLDNGRDGVYTVLDTGSKVRGRHIDLYLSDCRQAVKFGRRSVHVTVLRASQSY